MGFLMDLVRDIATIFFTTITAGLATLLVNNLSRAKRKTTLRRRKQKGGRSNK